MTIKAKIYSCYELTYQRVIHDIMSRIYHNAVEYQVIIEDISDNNSRSIQSQRSLKAYVTRTVRIYENDVLKHIVGLSNTNYDYDKQHEKESESSKKYIFGKDGYHANTYLLQGIPAIFNYYFEMKTQFPNIDLSFYLLDLEKSYPHNLFNILSYRELNTIGFKVLNIDEIDFSSFEETGCIINDTTDISYHSFNRYMNDIARISSKNSSNKSSYLSCEERFDNHNGTFEYIPEKYTYTFKVLSAQAYDTMLRIWCMKVLADKENVDIEFRLGKQYFAFNENERKTADKFTAPILKTLDFADISFIYYTKEEYLNEYDKSERSYINAKNKNEPRNSSLFRNNIRKKGVPTQCVICGNENSRVLQAAHIWEVTSIKNSNACTINSFISDNGMQSLMDQNNPHHNDLFYKKYCLTNSGDNGLWLCSNHHTLFDRNCYCFTSDDGSVDILSFDSTEQLEHFRSEMVENCKIPDFVLTPYTKSFIAKRNSLI